MPEKATDFTVRDALSLDSFTLSEHRGKVVLVTFATTKASHCIRMQETLLAIRESFD
ncbi:MAG: hypothetical protein KAU99_06845 [Thermoplasmata archaeon]|nr:hypothetical protein [Thermoplasmata archaeon]